MLTIIFVFLILSILFYILKLIIGFAAVLLFAAAYLIVKGVMKWLS